MTSPAATASADTDLGVVTTAPDGVQEVTLQTGDDYVFRPDTFTVAPLRSAPAVDLQGQPELEATQTGRPGIQDAVQHLGPLPQAQQAVPGARQARTGCAGRTVLDDDLHHPGAQLDRDVDRAPGRVLAGVGEPPWTVRYTARLTGVASSPARSIRQVVDVLGRAVDDVERAGSLHRERGGCGCHVGV